MENRISQLGYLNIVRKFFIFWKYLLDNIQSKQFKLILISVKYLLLKKSNSNDLQVCTRLGEFKIRKNTIDFKLINSAYEWFVLKAFRDELKTVDLFIDIGAHIGTYSIVAANNGVKTIAFEPIPTNYHSLENNIKLNKLNHLIKVFEFGLGTTDSVRKFNFNPLKPGASGVNPVKKNAKIIEVEIKKFDNLEIDEITNAKSFLLKVDVEGMELDVLNGMKKFIESAEHLSIIIESKHIGANEIGILLNSIAPFDCKIIDKFNVLARKLN